MTIELEKDIQSALNTTLVKAFPSTQMALENVDFKPPRNEVVWFRATLLPAEPSIETLGPSPHLMREGIFQVDIFYAVNVGFALPRQKANEVREAFFTGRLIEFNDISITVTKSWSGPGRRDDAGWYHIPVNVRYRCISSA